MSYKFILIALIVFCTFKAEAQYELDYINLGYRHHLNAKYKGFEDYSFQQKAFWVDFKKPFAIKESGHYLIPNLSYSFLRLDNNVYNNDQLNFHNINTGIGWYNDWKNPNWANYLEAGIGIGSDLKSLNGGHINANATLLFYYGKSESLVWNFGVDYFGGAFGHWAVPLAGVDWSINKKAHLSFQTFSHLSFDYALSQRLYLGIQASSSPFSLSITDYYGIKDSYVYTYSNKFPFSPQEIGLNIDLYLTDELVLFGNIAYEFAKELSHQDLNGAYIDDSAYNGKLNPGVIFQFGIALRTQDFRKKKSQ